MLTAYVDESYNENTFCVGGWLCSDDEWRRLERRWMQRINHEREISRQKRQKLISRFKASDCSTRKGEFEGWGIERQIGFMKKLTEIIGQSAPMGFSVAARLGDFVSGYPDKRDERWKGCYYYCMLAIFRIISEGMAKVHPKHKVTIIYDRGKVSEWGAQKAFSSLMRDHTSNAKDRFVTIAPMGWENCVALQPADLIAYEGFKVIDRRPANTSELRQSLQAIVGFGVPLTVHAFQPDAFRKLAEMQWKMDKAQENPTLDLKKVKALVNREVFRDRLK